MMFFFLGDRRIFVSVIIGVVGSLPCGSWQCHIEFFNHLLLLAFSCDSCGLRDSCGFFVLIVFDF